MGEYIGWIVFGAIINGIVFAGLCSSLAGNKGYDSTGGYGLAGFFFGALALLYVAGLPDMTLRSMISNLSKNIKTNTNEKSTSTSNPSNAKKTYELPPI